MKKLITDIRVGDLIKVDFGYVEPDFHWREVLEIRKSFGVFGDPVIDFRLETPYERDNRWFAFNEYALNGSPYYIEVKNGHNH